MKRKVKSYYKEYCDRYKPEDYLVERKMKGMGVDKQFKGEGFNEEPLSYMNIPKWELSSYLFLQHKDLYTKLCETDNTKRNREYIQYLRGKMDFIRDLLVDMGFDKNKSIIQRLKYDRGIEEVV